MMLRPPPETLTVILGVINDALEQASAKCIVDHASVFAGNFATISNRNVIDASAMPLARQQSKPVSDVQETTQLFERFRIKRRDIDAVADFAGLQVVD